MSSFIFSDDSFIFRLGLAILISLEKQLTADNMDEVATTLNNLIIHVEYLKVIRIYERIRISINDINKLRTMLT